jgi:hypothetical protein
VIDVEDKLHTFDDAQLQHLRDRSNAYGFDIKVTISDGSHSKPQLEQHVGDRLTGRNQVSIGVDPKHHYTYVRGSADLGLPSGPAMASAGNPFFKKGDMVGGIDAIAGRANSLKASRVVESATGAPIIVHEHTTSAGVWWGLGGLAVVVVAGVVWLLWRSSKRDAEARRLAAELNNEIGDRQIARAERSAVDDFDRRLRTTMGPPAAMPSSPPARLQYSTYPQSVPAPAPVIVNQGGNRDLLTDMLIFDAVTNPRRHDTVVRERVIERDSSSSSWGSSSGDSGSSSGSSWDSGSSSGSSSSSDWGGGSSDGGGGGGDSGGGGGDSW